MTNWRIIDEFPNYSVSDTGLVRFDKSGRVLAIHVNGHGIHYVCPFKDGRQYKRSVAVLVAEAFVSRPPQDRRGQFNSPIHLNGHKDDVHADNLMWRPFWFAREFHKQFKLGPSTAHPVLEMKTDERYSCPFIAGMAFGLLEKDIIASAVNRTFVFPTFQEFRFVE